MSCHPYCPGATSQAVEHLVQYQLTTCTGWQNFPVHSNQLPCFGLVAKPQFYFCQGRGGPALPQVIFHRTIYQKLVLRDAKIDQFAHYYHDSMFASLESRISVTRVKEESSWMTDWHVRRNFSSPWRVQVSSVLIVDVWSRFSKLNFVSLRQLI